MVQRRGEGAVVDRFGSAAMTQTSSTTSSRSADASPKAAGRRLPSPSHLACRMATLLQRVIDGRMDHGDDIHVALVKHRDEWIQLLRAEGYIVRACAHCGRLLNRRGMYRIDHEGRDVCRRSCSFHPIVLADPQS